MEMTAPDLTPGYPSKGAKLGPAWNDIWNALGRTGVFTDGRTLADEIAPEHEMAASTLVALMSRMALGGLLERQLQEVTTVNGKHRKRTHYRIPRAHVALEHAERQAS